MAKTALTQLQDQIEAIRREAFAAGYAAAMQSIREFTAKPAPGAEPAVAPPQRRPRAARPAPAPPAPRQRQPRAAAAPPRARRAAAARPQRGTNARLVEEVLQSNAPRALRPAEIRSAIRRDKGVALAFTSIRHALNQREERRTAEQVADSKTWRYRQGGSAASAAH
ncbi:MAG TPA: hypothetical protein VGQ90_11110 [Stellaceae bacterium]|nr:hypothetical protein [Stellaceae bacterium]